MALVDGFVLGWWSNSTLTEPDDFTNPNPNPKTLTPVKPNSKPWVLGIVSINPDNKPWACTALMAASKSIFERSAYLARILIWRTRYVFDRVAKPLIYGAGWSAIVVVSSVTTAAGAVKAPVLLEAGAGKGALVYWAADCALVIGRFFESKAMNGWLIGCAGVARL